MRSADLYMDPRRAAVMQATQQRLQNDTAGQQGPAGKDVGGILGSVIGGIAGAFAGNPMVGVSAGKALGSAIGGLADDDTSGLAAAPQQLFSLKWKDPDVADASAE